jgi:hypothetical protein
MQAFAPTTLVATGPLVMVTHQSAPWRGFQGADRFNMVSTRRRRW